MSAHVLVFAELTLRHRSLTAWRRERIDIAALEHLEDLPGRVWEGTTAELLDELTGLQDPAGRCEILLTGRRLRIAGYLTGESAALGMPLLAALSRAAQPRVEGVIAASMVVEQLTCFRALPRAARFVTADDPAQREALEQSPVALRANELYLAGSTHTQRTPAPDSAGPDRYRTPTQDELALMDCEAVLTVLATAKQMTDSMLDRLSKTATPRHLGAIEGLLATDPGPYARRRLRNLTARLRKQA